MAAALNILDGEVIGRCMRKHTDHEFIRFVNAVDGELRVGKMVDAIIDNYITHKHP